MVELALWGWLIVVGLPIMVFLMAKLGRYGYLKGQEAYYKDLHKAHKTDYQNVSQNGTTLSKRN